MKSVDGEAARRPHFKLEQPLELLRESCRFIRVDFSTPEIQ